MAIGIGIMPLAKELLFLLEMPLSVLNQKLQPLHDLGGLHALGDGMIEFVDQQQETFVILVDLGDTHAHLVAPLNGPLWLLHQNTRDSVLTSGYRLNAF